MIRRDVLLDTGPLVAVLDVRDQWHERYVSIWPKVIHRCVTTEAVITESTHLVGRDGGASFAPLEFTLVAGIPVPPLDAGALRGPLSLMQRYDDVPMDYADATLVTLAEGLGVSRRCSRLIEKVSRPRPRRTLSPIE